MSIRKLHCITLVGALAGALLSSGCMMAGMAGGMGPGATPGMDSHVASAATPVLAEARASGMHVTLEFSPALAGNEGTLTVNVRDSVGQAISPARVTLLLRRVGQDASSTIVPMAPAAHEAGLFRATHLFADAGSFVATAEVALDASDPSRVVSVTARQDIPRAPHASDRRSAVRPAAIAGGALMLGMVLWMVVAAGPFH